MAAAVFYGRVPPSQLDGGKKKVRFLGEDGVVSSGDEGIETEVEPLGMENNENSQAQNMYGSKPYRPLLKRRSRRRTKLPDPESPDVLAAQFKWARKSKDVELMRQVLEKLMAEKEDGPLREKLNDRVINEALLFIMLSGNVKISKMLLEAGASVKGADEIYNELRGDLSCCECGLHPGMLLVTLVRQATQPLLEFALDELPVDSHICDGDTRRMWWGTGYSFQGLNTIKTPILKSEVMKTTPLSAAIANNNLHIVQMLIDRGANIAVHDYLAFTEAAKLTDDPKHRILRFLFQKITSLPHFGTSEKLSNMFANASAAALRSAAENSDPSKLKFVIELIETEQEWTTSTRGGKAKKRPSVFKEMKLVEDPAESRSIHLRRGHTSLSSTSSWSSSSSACSSHSGNGSLCPTSMEKFHARKQSLQVMRPLIDQEAMTQRKRGAGGSAHQDFVSRAINIAIDRLIEDGTDPMHANRAALSRALEGLAILDSESLYERREDLFSVFLATLEQSGASAETSALALLDCGVDDFLLSSPTGSPQSKAEKKKSKAAQSDSGAPHTASKNLQQKTKKAWGKLKNGIAKSLSSSALAEKAAKHLGKQPLRRASSDEKMKALTLACTGGHVSVLERLLGKLEPSTFSVVGPKLLCVAAQNGNLSVIEPIKPYLGVDAHVAMCEACIIALEHQAFEFAEKLIKMGAVPEKSMFVDLLRSVLVKDSYREDSSDLLFSLLAEQGIKIFVDDVAHLADAVSATLTPNLYVFASILDLDESLRYAINSRHISRVVKISAQNTGNPDFGDLLIVLIRCIECKGEEERAKAIEEAYDEAVSQSPVHPVILTILMEQSGHHEQEETWV